MNLKIMGSCPAQDWFVVVGGEDNLFDILPLVCWAEVRMGNNLADRVEMIGVVAEEVGTRLVKPEETIRYAHKSQMPKILLDLVRKGMILIKDSVYISPYPDLQPRQEQ